MAREKRPGYVRPTLPFERKATLLRGAAQWSAVGLEFGLAVVLFFLGGRFLDGKLGTAPWLSVAGALVGIGVGSYLLLRSLLSASSKRTPDDPVEDDPTRTKPPGGRT
jgi:F0F1-type ATP synthase assembly protein I